jgi:ParB-like chromosome segregation protein Spo0J
MNLSLEIVIPKPEIVATSELRVDGKNPNKMSREQYNRLKTSIQKFGFIVPIITNKDLLIADGEQRWVIAKELAMPNVLVIRLPIEEFDRHLHVKS